MAYVNQYDLAQDATFRKRINVAQATAAVAVAGESQGSYSPAKYSKRQTLAREVLHDPALFVGLFAYAVVQNPAISAASTDSDIQFTVNSVWDDMAGVTGLD